MASGRLLIVAPDADLRLSLQFVLEAEGYMVTARANISETTAQERFDCTILDHRAAIGPTADIAAFCRRAHPVVLLASEPSRDRTGVPANSETAFGRAPVRCHTGRVDDATQPSP